MVSNGLTKSPAHILSFGCCLMFSFSRFGKLRLFSFYGFLQEWKKSCTTEHDPATVVPSQSDIDENIGWCLPVAKSVYQLLFWHVVVFDHPERTCFLFCVQTCLEKRKPLPPQLTKYVDRNLVLNSQIFIHSLACVIPRVISCDVTQLQGLT